MEWLQLQSSTFVENVGMSDSSGGITDPNPPVIPPEPGETFNIVGKLSKSKFADKSIAVTLRLPFVLPVNITVNYRLKVGSGGGNFSITIANNEHLLYKTFVHSNIIVFPFDYDDYSLEILSVVPETFIHDGDTYNVNVDTL